MPGVRPICDSRGRKGPGRRLWHSYVSLGAFLISVEVELDELGGTHGAPRWWSRTSAVALRATSDAWSALNL